MVKRVQLGPHCRGTPPVPPVLCPLPVRTVGKRAVGILLESFLVFILQKNPGGVLWNTVQKIRKIFLFCVKYTYKCNNNPEYDNEGQGSFEPR